MQGPYRSRHAASRHSGAPGLARGTVRKFARAESVPVRLPHGPAPSILGPFLPHLERRLAGGCETGMLLWRELRGMGLPGGNTQVHRWLAERRTVPAKVGRRRVELPGDALTAAGGRRSTLPTARQRAWLLVQPAEALHDADVAAVRRGEQDGEARIAATLARRFTALVRACGARRRKEGAAPVAPEAALDAWLAEARTCGVGPVETFAAGLEQDGAAVRAALTQTWSSGQAEGQVNRLTLLKRQSYAGPASTCCASAFCSRHDPRKTRENRQRGGNREWKWSSHDQAASAPAPDPAGSGRGRRRRAPSRRRLDQRRA